MKLLYFFFFFIAVGTIIAQNKSDSKQNEPSYLTVTYKSNVYKSLEDSTIVLTSFDKKHIEDRNYVQNNLEFVLYCDKEKSLYKVVDKLDLRDGDPEFEMEKMSLGARHKYFINNTEKENIKQTDLTGESFNIVLPFTKYNWNITTETKTINGYLCYKATAHYEEFQKFRNRTLSFDPLVWFAPKLPYPFGPKGMHGLPGLIMEGSINGKTYFYASKIVFNSELKSPIVKPKGKSITADEYEDIQIKNMKLKY